MLLTLTGERPIPARVSAAYREAVVRIRAIVRIVRTENLSLLAAGIAHYTVISLVPFLALLVTAISLVGGETFALRLLGAAETVLVPRPQSPAAATIRGAVRDTQLSVVSGIVFLWGTLRIFRGLDTAFSTIYGRRNPKSIVTQFRDAFIVMLAISVALAAASVLGFRYLHSLVLTMARTGASVLGFKSALSIPPEPVGSQLLLFLGLFLVFLPIYYVFPDTEGSLSQVVPGAVVAAVGWAVLDVLFQFYLVVAPRTTAYGVMGAILLVLLWLYLGGFSLLFGAVLNAVVAGHRVTPESDD